MDTRAVAVYLVDNLELKRVARTVVSIQANVLYLITATRRICTSRMFRRLVLRSNNRLHMCRRVLCIHAMLRSISRQ